MNFIRSICLILSCSFGTALLSAALPEPGQGIAPAAPPAAPTKTDPRAQIDLNTVDVKTLAEMPEIGPELALAIVAARPFDSIDDLSRVRGMTAEQLEQIRAKITTVPAGTAVRRQLAGRASEDAVHVPGDMSRPIASGKKKADLNTANLKTLAAVPSIGPELAPAIIAARPFSSVDELNRVPGINAERLEQIRADVSVTPVAKNPRR